MTLIEGNYGEMWGGNAHGVYNLTYDAENDIHKIDGHYANDITRPGSLSKNNVRCLYKDKSGIIWIGTNGGGVDKLNPSKKDFLHFSKNLNSGSLSYNKIRSIFEDSRGNLWIGTEGGGVNYLAAAGQSPDYNQFKHINTVSNVFAIAETDIEKEQSTIWFGSEGNNLSRLSRKGRSQILDIDFGKKLGIKNSVFAIHHDHTGSLWVGTYNGGLYRLDQDEAGDYRLSHFRHRSGKQNSLANNIIRSLEQDAQGNLWIGTANGLSMIRENELDARQPDFINYRDVNSQTPGLSHNYILSIHESKNGDLWIGTFGGGLNKLIKSSDGNVHFKVYREKDGLPNNVIKSILEDESGKLWIATNKGLSHFDPRQETFKNYDVSDGLQSNEFSELASFKRKDGQMLFGGVNGFNAFYPDSITDNPYLPQLAITDFRIFNRSILPGDEMNGRVILDKTISKSTELNLKHAENNISFEFSALHFAAPTKNQFAYKLEGFDEDWTYTNSSRRFASYTNLKHGEYVLKVKAANNDGVWNITPLTLKIRIAPPFWLSWWAYIIYAILFVTVILFIRKYTLIGIKEKHQLELEHLEKEKTEELHQMKMRFFTNISHEFRTPLTLILGPLEYLLKDNHSVSKEDQQRHYTLMQKNAKFLLRLVNQLMDFRKLDQGKMKLKLQKESVNTVLGEITEPFQFIAQRKNIDYSVNQAREEIEAWVDTDKVEKMLYNLLSNAFKFTPEGGKVEVKLYREEPSFKSNLGYYAIEVKDSGSGIPDDQVKHIFERFYQVHGREKAKHEGSGIGLSFVKSLVELHQGKISFHTQCGQGSCFKILLPLGKSAFHKSDFLHNDVEVQANLPVEAWIDIEDETRREESKHKKKLLTLLIVDDHADIRRFVRQSFADEFNILEAENGLLGLEKARNSHPDIVVADVMMPEMNGIEMCQTLKSETATSHIPVILLTAKNTEDNEIQGLRNGADLYIAKPFNMEKLQITVANLVRGREELKKKFTREVLIQPSEVTVTPADETFLKSAISLVEENMEDPEFNVEQLVKELGMSRSKLHLKMKAVTGQSCSEFIRTIRLKRAVQLLEKSEMSVKEVMSYTGFSTASYFSKCFRKQFGVIPSEYVKRHLNSEEVE
ncbi:signal transduction histidine kinase/DNA-binding response OmpR family regulator/streptogramin lyase [Catalinimonas alkaloidigena]|uniref:hybrid sensor histidine kinase/response regulator transcription factor n=1 Tax=Catalinimonas alkaloidigena TaxID=1075417 RepID=UPI002405CA4C|nr:two-component regulator propeller domain-containing protein [Catalinimonas alkaloidigena]MDF9796461.1 signal transduction histidine kinase/DNA-binding response OmpR family regulator/streptogramin lyase [Catalinimonas alkaloidigena]